MDFRKLVRRTYKGVIAIILLSLLAGVLFFYFEQGNQGETLSLFDSIYWAVVTMTTVGYGDFTPVTPEGRLIFIILGTSGVVLWGFLASVVVSLVVESNLSGVFGLDKCKFEDHFVLCGWTSIGEIALEELLLDDKKIAVITNDKDDVTTIKRKGNRKNLFSIYGDPSKAEILEQAGIDRASVVILCMDDDSKNLITALHIKDRNPSARLIVKTNRSELKETMEIAGVTFVTTPHELSGRLVASAAFEPDVANLIDDITTATNVGGYDLREYVLSKKGTVKNLSRELKEKTNTTLLAVAKQSKEDDKWKLHPNPDQDMIVNPGDTIVLLGNENEFESVEKLLGRTHGR